VLGLQVVPLLVVDDVEAVGAVKAVGSGCIFPRFYAVVGAGSGQNGPHTVAAGELVVEFVGAGAEAGIEICRVGQGGVAASLVCVWRGCWRRGSG